MEPWQQDVIMEKKSKLVELIVPTIDLIAKLESSKHLSPETSDSLKLGNKTRGKIVHELLDFLIKQKGAYERLRIALKEDFQEAAAELLPQGNRGHGSEGNNWRKGAYERFCSSLKEDFQTTATDNLNQEEHEYDLR